MVMMGTSYTNVCALVGTGHGAQEREGVGENGAEKTHTKMSLPLFNTILKTFPLKFGINIFGCYTGNCATFVS